MNILLKDGTTYKVDTYVPDATGSFLGFNASGLSASTSPTVLTVPKGAVAIVAWNLDTAPTAVGFNIIVNSGSKAGYTVRHAFAVKSLATREPIYFPVSEGDQLSAVQF